MVGSLAFFLLSVGLGVIDDKAGHEAYSDARLAALTSKETVVVPRKSLEALAGYVSWHKGLMAAGCNVMVFLGGLLIASGAVGVKRQQVARGVSQQAPAAGPPARPH